MSSEIFEFCKISDLFFNCQLKKAFKKKDFASQSKGINIGD